MEEIWKDIILIPYHQAEWPYHQVSNRGRIRVLPGGKVGAGRIVTEIELRKLTRNDKGYMIIRQGKLVLLRVHIIVLNQFWGPCPPGQECRHLNGNPADNRYPENLEWGTHKENYQDQLSHGTASNGEHHGCAKLTESQITEIRNGPDYWGITRHLAKEYKVCHSTISAIRSRRLWKLIK